MRKKLTRQGNSAALVIDKPLLELLDLKAGGAVDVQTDGTSLLVRPVRSLDARRRAAFARALAETNRAWGGMLRRLANR
jgi:antitoxin MazE